MNTLEAELLIPLSAMVRRRLDLQPRPWTQLDCQGFAEGEGCRWLLILKDAESAGAKAFLSVAAEMDDYPFGVASDDAVLPNTLPKMDRLSF